MYTTTNECFTCHSFCDGCTASTSSSDCINCATGYYMLNGVCTVCDDACSSCTGGGFANCASCSSGYYSGGFGICYLTCSSGDYLYTNTNECFTCHNSCNGCSATNSDTSCVDCATHYYTSSPYCLVCNDACGDCYNSGFNHCSSCASGYESGGTGICYLTCNAGDYLYTTTNECFTCDVSCDGCTVSNSNSKCINCATSYYDSYGVCTACNSACADCTNGGFTNCGNCASGYFSGGSGICYKTCSTG